MMLSPHTLADRVAIVTGADRGIGSAIVSRLLADGYRVVAADLGPTGCEAYADDDRVAIVLADVSVRTDAERIVATALERFGRLDALVNNAGILDRFLPVGEVSDEVWAKVIVVNLTGPMYLARAAMPHLIASRGVVVNVSSVGGLFGGRAGAAYVASKHGLIGLTKNIAATYAADGVRAVAIAPGGVSTGIGVGGEPSARGYAALNKTLAASVRMAEPCEIAALVAFAISGDASFVSGAVLVADGGWTAF